MPPFVTRIVLSRRAPVRTRSPGAPIDAAARDAQAFRCRLARLHVPAPDTLRARVRRELRAAAAAETLRSE
jgi:hypothetical protein